MHLTNTRRLFAFAALLLLTSAAFADVVKIGVRANKGAEQAMQEWQPTVDYLNRAIPEHRFMLLAYEDNATLNNAVLNDEMAFVITNSAAYVELQIKAGVTRILTMQNRANGLVLGEYGSVIFTRADRNDLNQITDLRGKRFMGVDPKGFGGWRVAWRELKRNGIDPQDLKELHFGGGIQQNVVYAVRDGIVDAGSVRTDLLERLAAEGKIALKDFKVLGARSTPGFPYLHSTPLYPEWPLAKAAGTSQALAKQVTLALLQMPQDHPAAKAGRYAGWTVPGDYHLVQELLRELRLAPFDQEDPVTPSAILRQYWPWLLAILAAFSIVAITALYIGRINRRLRQTALSLQEANVNMGERVKEMNCLFSVSRALEDISQPLDRTLQAVVDALPPGWQFPTSTAAQLRYHEREFHTQDFAESKLLQVAPISENGNAVGEISVHLALDAGVDPERPFLQEEASLLNEISRRIDNHIDRRRLLGALQESNEELENRIKARTRELLLAMEVAENASKAKSDFLARMSHELRTPMNAVLGFAQIGQVTGKEHDCQQYFAEILTAGNHLLGVINDVLDFSKIEAGKLGIEKAPFDLRSVVDQSAALVKQLAMGKGLDLRVEVSPDLPAYCLGDSFRLSQVLNNILSNAVKFTTTGGVTLAVARDGDRLLFRITDTGIGIDETEHERIFSAFEQEDGSSTRRFGGTGLGLAITKRLVDLMEGDIRVQSQRWKGATFEIRLPLVEAETAPTTDAAPARAQHLGGLRILVAEDNDGNQRFMEKLLTANGAITTMVSNGREAVERVIQDGRGGHDIVLMDIQMPEMNGFEASRRIRELMPDLPIVALTANAMTEDREKCLSAGMVDHIAKPINARQLVEIVLRHT